MHGLPKNIILDRDTKFTLNFWKTSFSGLDTQLNLSTLYHPQIDGHTKRTNSIVEDMLRMYVMDFPTKWEEYLHLVEFAYNISYHTSLKMSPFELMYKRMCRTPISCDNPVDRIILGLDMIKQNGNNCSKRKKEKKKLEKCTG
jgi:hypothetical protein